jgi:hypothetical protein
VEPDIGEVESIDPVDVVDAPDPGDPDEERPDEEGLDLEIALDLPQEPAAAAAVSQEPLLDLQSAIERVPSGLRKEMEQVLRAEFREVIRWKAPK